MSTGSISQDEANKLVVLLGELESAAMKVSEAFIDWDTTVALTPKPAIATLDVKFENRIRAVENVSKVRRKILGMLQKHVKE